MDESQIDGKVMTLLRPEKCQVGVELWQRALQKKDEKQ